MKPIIKLSSIDNFRSKSSQLLNFVEVELGTFDILKTGSDSDQNVSFLFNLISELKALDVSSVSNFLCKTGDEYSTFFQDQRVKCEADVRDGRVFAKRGAPKKSQDNTFERRRRQSFAATTFGDLEVILSTETIKSMSDLNFIFSLNAFFLPYCDSNKQRTMYEHFFDKFLCVIHEKEASSSSFRLLQESVMIIQKISEAWMNLIEVLLEMLSIGYTRIRTHEAMMTPRLKSSFDTETSDETERRLAEVVKIITSQDKVYRMIGTGSLTDANSKRVKIPTLMMKPENYLDKFNDQLEILELARETNMTTIDMSVIIISEFTEEFPNFVSNLRLYIETFRTFSDSLDEKSGVFQTFASSFLNMCKTLDMHESNLNVVLESPRRSPKESKWFSPRKKSIGSPRIEEK